MTPDPPSPVRDAAALPVNPWLQLSSALGVVALVTGLLLAVLGAPSGFADDAGPGLVRVVVGLGVAAVGVGLLLSALVLAGVGWYLRAERRPPGP